MLVQTLLLGYLKLLSASPDYGAQGLVGDVDLTLEKIDDNTPWNNDIYIGQVARLKVTADFTSIRESTKDTTITLLISDDDDGVMVKSQILERHDGSSLEIGGGLHSIMETRASIRNYHEMPYNYITKIEIELGTVTKLPHTTGIDNTEFNVAIVYDIVCVSMGGHTIGTQYNTSALLKYVYKGEQHLAKSSTNYTLKGEKVQEETADRAILTRNVPEEIELLQPLTFNLTLTLPHPITNLEVSVSTWDMSGENYQENAAEILVQEIQGVSVGFGFDYALSATSIRAVGYNTCPMSTSLTLTLKKLINRAWQTEDEIGNEEGTELSDIVLRTTLLMTRRGDADGINVNILITTERNAFTFPMILVVLGREQPFPTVPRSIAIETQDEIRIPAGQQGYLELTMDIPERSSGTYSGDIVIYSTDQTADSFYIDRDVRLISMQPVFYGENLRCQNISVTLTDKQFENGIGFYEFDFSIMNIGIHTEPDANVLKLKVLLSIGAATSRGTGYTLEVAMHTLHSKTRLIAEDPIVGDIASIHLVNSCPTAEYYLDMLAVFRLTIVTARNVISGPVIITSFWDTTIPSYSLHSGDIVSMGKNVECVSIGPLIPYSLDKLSSMVKLPRLCNTEIVNSTAEDEVVIELRANLTEQTVSFDKRNVSFHIAVSEKFFHNRKLPLVIRSPGERPLSKRVIGVNVSRGELTNDFLEHIKLQWSQDNREFMDAPFVFSKEPDDDDKEWVYLHLLKTRFAQFVRTINRTSGCLKKYGIALSEDVPIISGPAEKTSILRHSIIDALDWSPETCMSLPRQSESGTVPFLWAELKQSFFGGGIHIPVEITLTGYGLYCHDENPLQRTMVVFPKPDPAVSQEENPHEQCRFSRSYRNPSNFTTCTLTCQCVNEFECSAFTLLILHMGIEGPYRLCDVSIKSGKKLNGVEK